VTPDFVREVQEALNEGRVERIGDLVGELHSTDLADLISVITRDSIKDSDFQTEKEIEEVDEGDEAREVETTVSARNPEAELPPETDLAETLLDRLRVRFNQLDADTLEPEVLYDLSAKLTKLAQLAENTKQQRHIAPVLARFDESSARHEKIIVRVGAVAAIEAQRVRLSEPGVSIVEVEEWIEGMVVRLVTIEGHDEVIRGLMRQISAAAAEDDLAAILLLTAEVRKRNVPREEAVNDFRNHLG
jgi:hypothetical protein